jgi:hypothetical protein
MCSHTDVARSRKAEFAEVALAHQVRECVAKEGEV